MSLPLPEPRGTHPFCRSGFWVVKFSFSREGKTGQGGEGGFSSRDDAERAASLRSFTASLCAVESQMGFIPLHGVSRM